MYQTAALLGDIMVGLPSKQHPRGGSVYAVRDGSEFLYIGKTINQVWPLICQHVQSEHALGRAVRAEPSRSAAWRVEVCNFGGEAGLTIVERELIRRYRPRLNEHHNTGRLRTPLEQL